MTLNRRRRRRHHHECDSAGKYFYKWRINGTASIIKHGKLFIAVVLFASSAASRFAKPFDFLHSTHSFFS